MSETAVLNLLHLLGAALAFGSAFSFAFIVYPGVRKMESVPARLQALAGIVKYYHPFFLLGLCVAFLTGAFRLTDLKIFFGSQYYDVLGGPLLWKFALTLLIFLGAGGQCFGLGLKFTRMVSGVIPADEATQQRYAAKLRRFTIINLILITVTMGVGLHLAGAVW